MFKIILILRSLMTQNIPQNSEIFAIFLIFAIIDREPHSRGLVGNVKVGF